MYGQLASMDATDKHPYKNPRRKKTWETTMKSVIHIIFRLLFSVSLVKVSIIGIILTSVNMINMINMINTCRLWCLSNHNVNICSRWSPSRDLLGSILFRSLLCSLYIIQSYITKWAQLSDYFMQWLRACMQGQRLIMRSCKCTYYMHTTNSSVYK